MSGLDSGARDLMAALRASLDAARDEQSKAAKRPVVADTTAGAQDCGCGGTGIRQFDSDGYEACPVHLRRALAGPDDTQQDGAR